MRTILDLFVMFAVLSQPSVFAAENPALPPGQGTSAPLQKPVLRAAIEREVVRLTFSRERAFPPRRQAGPVDRGWIRRHPALFGALAGAGIGAASSAVEWTELYCATGGDEDCLFHGGMGVLFGAGAGTGIGSLVGWLVGR